MNRSVDATRLLGELRGGRETAAAELLPLVYEELRALAGRFLRREAAGHTLQPTALVHEAYLHLVDQTRASYLDRQHFFAVAATAMRRILIDHARGRGRQRRGGGRARVELDEGIDACEQSQVDLLALDDALTQLGELDPLKARIVELRFFAGLTVDEVAQVLATSPRTVKREWAVAQGWLYQQLSDADES